MVVINFFITYLNLITIVLRGLFIFIRETTKEKNMTEPSINNKTHAIN